MISKSSVCVVFNSETSILTLFGYHFAETFPVCVGAPKELIRFNSPLDRFLGNLYAIYGELLFLFILFNFNILENTDMESLSTVRIIKKNVTSVYDNLDTLHLLNCVLCWSICILFSFTDSKAAAF
jgi:hypothetical protein